MSRRGNPKKRRAWRLRAVTDAVANVLTGDRQRFNLGDHVEFRANIDRDGHVVGHTTWYGAPDEYRVLWKDGTETTVEETEIDDYCPF